MNSKKTKNINNKPRIRGQEAIHCFFAVHNLPSEYGVFIAHRYGYDRPRFASGYERYAQKILTDRQSIAMTAKAWKKQVVPDPHVIIVPSRGWLV